MGPFCLPDPVNVIYVHVYSTQAVVQPACESELAQRVYSELSPDSFIRGLVIRVVQRVDAGEHDHKHGKCSQLQQQVQTGSPRDEGRGQQRSEYGHKKGGAEANGRRALKNQPPKQSPF